MNTNHCGQDAEAPSRLNQLIMKSSFSSACDKQSALDLASELRAENDKLREALAGKVYSETMLTELAIKNGGINLSIAGGACALFADAFADQFIGSQAINYVEASFTSNKLPGEMLAVTIQRVSGKMPHQCRQEAEAESAELRRQLDLVTGEMGVAHRHMEQVAVIDEVAELEAVMDAVADALGDAYDCRRVWEAWFVGTMSQNDFARVADSGERLAEIASAAIGAMRKLAGSPAGEGGKS